MIGQRSLCLLLLAAGTLGAQTAPAPPRRPFCGQQPKADDRRLPSTLAPVVSRASLIGADRLSPGSTSAVPATAIDTTPLSPDQLSPREAALIDSVVAKFPGARGAEVRRWLMLRTSVGLSLGGVPPAAQAMVDEVFRLRRARRDSVTLAEMQRERAAAPILYPATVLLVHRLGDPAALAEVIRRTQPWREDLLVLASSNATDRALASALHVLGDMRRATTEAPSMPESTYVTRSYAPADTVQRRFDRSAIDEVIHAAPVDIPGFGHVLACAVSVTSQPPPRPARH